MDDKRADEIIEYGKNDYPVSLEVYNINRITVAAGMVTIGKRTYCAEGISKCSSGDKLCEKRGAEIASGRAVEALIKKINNEKINNHYMA